MRRRKLVIGSGVLVAVLVVTDWMAGGVSRRLVFGTATIAVTSIPAGAKVFVDGEPMGVTPLRTTVAPGEVILKLSHRFHTDRVERITVQRGDERAVSVTFAPATGALRVITNPTGAEVSIDGEMVGQTPLNMPGVATGTHSVRVRIPGRSPVDRSVDVLPEETAEINVDLERIPTGALIVQTTPPDASITFADGASTYQAGMTLPTGSYVLDVKRPGYESRSVTVKVSAGRNVHSVALDQLFANVTLRLKPADAKVSVSHGAGRLAVTENYHPGMRLAVGRFEVTARARGYRRYRNTFELGAAGIDTTIALLRIDAQPGDVIRDALNVGGDGPQMVVIGAGASDEDPFAIAVHELTRAEYRLFADATGRHFPAPKEHETDRHPIVNVDRDDAIAYTKWLSAQTGHTYRLPRESEWDLMARTDIAPSVCAHGNVADAAAAKIYRGWDTVDCDDGHVRSAPVASYRANSSGVHDAIGNVTEWVLDCWRLDRSETDDADCMNYMVKGGSWDTAVNGAHLAVREPASTAADDRGFRVLREF